MYCDTSKKPLETFIYNLEFFLNLAEFNGWKKHSSDPEPFDLKNVFLFILGLCEHIKIDKISINVVLFKKN